MKSKMKFLLNSFAIIFIIIVCLKNTNVEAKLQCKAPPVEIPKDWITMVDPCIKKMQNQVQQELIAAMTYLAMGAHFSKDTVNRQGFAKFFFDSASEEREHAIKLIHYLLMRGELTSDVAQLIRDPFPLAESWIDGLTALKEALQLEANVTKKLRDIASTCENPGKDGDNFNDYHLVDWITGEYLEEQYKGQRQLAGHITTLGKMMHTNPALAEYLYDKKLLFGKDFISDSVAA
ncbi:hypothetical protein PGB90_004622 [Kerria lacca]